MSAASGPPADARVAELELQVAELTEQNAKLQSELTIARPEPKPPADDIPWKRIIVLYTVVMTDGLIASSLFPIVPYLIRDCGVAEPDVGYYAGMLASIFNLGQFFSAVFWGKTSDRHGRKPVLYIGLIAASTSQVLFGLSKSVGYAVACRAIGGLLSANVTVAKAMIKDITPKEHTGKAFAALGTFMGIGFMGGPTLGGLLSRPADTMPGIFGSGCLSDIDDELANGTFAAEHELIDAACEHCGCTVWERYPYLLPCLCSVILAPVGLVCLQFMEESQGPRAKRAKVGAVNGTDGAAAKADAHGDGGTKDGAAQNGGGLEEVTEAEAEASIVVAEDSSAAPGGGGGGGANGGGASGGARSSTREHDDAVLLHAGKHASAKRAPTRGGGRFAPGWPARLRRLLTGRIMMVVYSSCVLGFVVVGMQELFPLFAANKERGLSLEPSQLGAAIAPMGITLVLFPMVLPKLIKATSPTFAFRLGSALFLVINALLPQMRAALDAGGPSLLWTCLIAFALSRSCAGVCTFISNTILLNGLLSDSGNVGFYNGLNDSLSALGRGVAPVITGTMFAAMTTSDAYFPFDEHLPFYFISLLSFVAILLSFGFARRKERTSDSGSDG